MSSIKPISASNRHVSKMARRIREEEEAKIMGIEKGPPKPASYLDKEGRKHFRKFVKLHDHLNETDSEDLSQLCQYLVLHREAMKAMNGLDIFSKEYGNHLTQIMKFDKLIMSYMSHLCLTYRERLRLSNEMTKLRVEEMKLEQMNGQAKEANPLLELLKKLD